MREQVIKLRNELITFVLGDTFVDEEVKEFRENECRNNCPLYDSNNDKCTICKCYIEVKTPMKTNFNIKKMRYEITHCPDGRWNDKHILEYFTNK